MEKLRLGVLVTVVLLMVSCEEEEGCSELLNAQIDGVCTSGSVVDYDVAFEQNGNDFVPIGESLSIEFRGEGNNYLLFINPGTNYYDQGTQSFVVEPAFLTAGAELTSDISGSNISQIGRTNLSTDLFTITITKADRDNGLISGVFTWNYTAFSLDAEGQASISGRFDDVPYNGFVQIP